MAVMILPALSFGVYNVLIFVPLLNAALAAKVIENSADYSLNNTVRNMLFLPCSYEQKFAAKQAIDSFFVRMGDVLSAALVFVGTTFLALPTRGFAGVNAVLAVVALILAWRVGRHYKALTASTARHRRRPPPHDPPCPRRRQWRREGTDAPHRGHRVDDRRNCRDPGRGTAGRDQVHLDLQVDGCRRGELRGEEGGRTGHLERRLAAHVAAKSRWPAS